MTVALRMAVAGQREAARTAYWYNGYIYGSEIARGGDEITWPASFAVARAYLDQLGRSSALAPARIASLNAAIAKADSGKGIAQLKTEAVYAERLRALAAIPGQKGAARP